MEKNGQESHVCFSSWPFCVISTMRIVYIRREKQSTKQNEIKEESPFHPKRQTTPNMGSC